MLLHTVSRSPECSNALQSCLRAALPGACLLLLEDGVYAARTGSPQLEAILQTGLTCYALAEDSAARGIAIDPRVVAVDTAGFVQLCTECHAVQAWY